MRVLHLFSNSRWTGPAEPAVNLCASLRDKGIDIAFACAPYTASGQNKVVAVAREKGLAPLDFLHITKHRHPIKNLLDVYALRRHIKQNTHDIIHCHLDNDHAVALAAVRGLHIPVVRSNHFGDGFPNDRRHRQLVTRSALILEPSQHALAADQKAFSLPPEMTAVVPGAVDTQRFNPARPLPDMRRRLGIPVEAFVVGIVARMQPHRHYEDLFDAFHRFSQAAENAHLVVVGRGTRQRDVGFAPVARLGLTDRVHFTGYLDADEYVGMLRTFDVGMFLVPGTDGTCRAVREMMAMSTPMVVANRGMLHEIIQHETEGLVTDGSIEELSAALSRLYREPELRNRFADNARATAHTRYTLDHQAECVIDAYKELLARPSAALRR